MLTTKATRLLLVLLTAGLLGAGALLLPLPSLGGSPAPKGAGGGDQPAASGQPGPRPEVRRVRRACIILWMGGGPSQLDTFDLKPGNPNGGPFQEIDTRVKGIRISEHLPLLAERADRLAIIRSLTHKDGDHRRASYRMHTGRGYDGETAYPSVGAVLAKELRLPGSELPPYVNVGPDLLGAVAPEAYGSGFLGDEFAPLSVEVRRGRDPTPVLPPPEAFAKIDKGKAEAMRNAVRKAFDLGQEKAAVRDLYGRNPFGQGCLLARRLVEQGVPVVEVTLGGWDGHTNNFDIVRARSAQLDPAFAFLLKDLEDRKLLDHTLVVWMGEFGRTPKINARQGRDHWSSGFSVVLAGAGIKGGQVIGRTSDDGFKVTERPVTQAELHATIYRALGIDPAKENRSNLGKPVPLVEGGAQPVKEALK